MTSDDRREAAGSRGLVIVGHGSHRSPAASAPVHDHVDRVRDLGGFDAVKPAFWQGEPGLRDVVRTLGTEHVRVVPLLMAPGYFADRVFPRELRLGSDEPLRTASTVEYTSPVGTHPRLTEVIAQRASGVADGEDVGIALVGHGTPRHDGSSTSTHDHVARLQARGSFDEVAAFFLDEAPSVETITDEMAAPEVVIVPLFVADGPHARVDVPQAVGLPPRPQGSTLVDDTRLWYTGAVGTAPELTDVILDLATSSPPERVAHGSRGGRDVAAAVAALGEWLEVREDRPWGELRIVRSPSSSPPRYTVCHERDAERDPDALTSLSDLAAVRETVRFDDQGRYRPLAGARTLPTGWIAPDRSLDALADLLEVVYPASVVNWFRERTGRLDATSFSAAATRHSGRFSDLAAIPPSVRRATETACCGDCVRRPAWSEPDTQDSDDEIPCREPCSFLLAAVTAFDSIESSSASGCANDRPIPAGALDTPGNRYRRRFLEASDREGVLAGGDGS